MADATFDRLTIGDAHGRCLFLTAEIISLYQRPGKLLASLTNENGCPSLTLYDSNEQERISLSIDDHGEPEIALTDGNGQKRLLATMDNEGKPILKLHDALGKSRAEVRLLDEGTPSLAFHDKDEELRFHLLLHEDEADILAMPKDGEQRWGSLLRQSAKKGKV